MSIIVVRPLDRAMAQIYAVLMKQEGRMVLVCETEAEAWPPSTPLSR
jgi:hypothetical protein